MGNEEQSLKKPIEKEPDLETDLAKREEAEFIEHYGEEEDEEIDAPENKNNTNLRAKKKRRYNKKSYSYNEKSNSKENQKNKKEIEYFFKELSPFEKEEIKNYIENNVTKGNSTPSESEIDEFFKKYPKIKKGNSQQIFEM